MADNNEELFVFNVDVKKALQGLGDMQAKIDKLGEADSLKSLLGVMEEFGPILAIVATAALAAKVAFDAILDAEKIKATEAAFEMLAKTSGIAFKELREGLLNAAGGLATETEVLAAANKGIVELGGNATQLTRTMDLARVYTKAFGGDLIQNFENINRAIATGNERQLKQMGIAIDNKKAMIEYAKAHGIAVKALSDEEMQAARLEAVMKRYESRMAGIKDIQTPVTTQWKQFKVTLSEFGEAAEVAWNKIGGPVAAVLLKNATLAVNALKNAMKFNVKEVLQDEFQLLTGIDLHSKEIKKTADEAARAVASASTAGPKADPEKRLQEETKFQQDLLKLKEQAHQAEMANMTTESQFQRLFREERALEDKKFMEEKQQILLNAKNGEYASEQEKYQLLDQLAREHAAHLASLEQKKKQMNDQYLQQNLERSKSSAEGIARAFEQASKRQQKGLTDYAAVGTRVFNSFDNNVTSSLEAWGAGTKTAAEAAKGFILGMLADEAEARGKVLLLASIWPPNPAGIAAGAGLIALAGFLKSQASSGSTSGGGGGGFSSASLGGGGGSAGVAIDTTAPSLDTSPAASVQGPRKAVTVSIQGSYIETDQTRRWLMDLIRQESDATDFKYIQIGQT